MRHTDAFDLRGRGPKRRYNRIASRKIAAKTAAVTYNDVVAVVKSRRVTDEEERNRASSVTREHLLERAVRAKDDMHLNMSSKRGVPDLKVKHLSKSQKSSRVRSGSKNSTTQTFKVEDVLRRVDANDEPDTKTTTTTSVTITSGRHSRSRNRPRSNSDVPYTSLHTPPIPELPSAEQIQRYERKMSRRGEVGVVVGEKKNTRGGSKSRRSNRSSKLMESDASPARKPKRTMSDCTASTIAEVELDTPVKPLGGGCCCFGCRLCVRQ